MKATALSLVSLGLASVQAQDESQYMPSDPPVKPFVLTPEPYTYLSEVPDSVDWRNYNGTNFCNGVLNQKNPSVCGSCWAQAATGALSDRYKIATNNKFSSTLAPQNLINFNRRYIYMCVVVFTNLNDFANHLQFFFNYYNFLCLELRGEVASGEITSRPISSFTRMAFLTTTACHMQV